jgi:hypothetical protein
VSRFPLFVPLISIFFVLHGALENFGFIPFTDALALVFAYIGLTLIIGSLVWLLFRDMRATAIGTTALLAFFFFYEAFIQFLIKRFPHRFFTSSAFLLAVGLFALIATFIYLKKNKRPFPRLYLFLNATLLIYILVDTGGLVLKLRHPPVNPLSVYSFAKVETTPPCTACAKPDVYFLLFDEFASTLALKEQSNFDNSSLDSFLIGQGFHINPYSSANYNFTPFSMASILNMSYIEGLKYPNRIVAEDYAHSFQLIRDNEVIKVFSREGYEVKNFSIFDLAGQPTEAWQSFLPLKTRLITARTLAERLNKSINALLVRYLGIRYFVVQEYMKYHSSNEEFLKRVASEADRRNNKPRFLYAHFMMPHSPFLFDSSGLRKTDEQIYAQMSTDTAAFHRDYLSYLQYTNKRLESLVLHIRQSAPDAVILLCGDHGYRGWAEKDEPGFQFQNLNAVFFPDHDYTRWNKKRSMVNQFRIVFNQLFQTRYPMLKDSTISLNE